MNLMSREMTRTRPSPVTVEAVQEGIKPMADVLVSILNELVPDLPFERRVLIGFSVVGQCLYYRQNRAVGEVLFGAELVNGFNAPTIADHIADLVLRGIGKPLAASHGGKSS